MTANPVLPDGVQLLRTTEVFDDHTIPTALLAAHRTAPEVWGRLVIHDGTAAFLFEDRPDDFHRLHQGDSIVIPPQRRHRIVIDGAVRLAVEFYRVPRDHPDRSRS